MQSEAASVQRPIAEQQLVISSTVRLKQGPPHALHLTEKHRVLERSVETMRGSIYSLQQRYMGVHEHVTYTIVHYTRTCLHFCWRSGTVKALIFFHTSHYGSPSGSDWLSFGTNNNIT